MGIKIDLKTNTMLKLHVVAAVSCVIYDRNTYIYIYMYATFETFSVLS